MFQTTLAGLLARKIRLAATAIAIVLGVGFISGTLIFSDTAKAGIYEGTARFARNVDVVVRGAAADAATGPALPATVVQQVRDTSGVARASGRMSHPLPVLDKKGKLLGDYNQPGLAMFFDAVPELHPFDLTAGHLPTRSGEIAVEKQTAERAGFTVGGTVTVLDLNQKRAALTVAGIVDFGSVKALAGTPVIVVTRQDMATLTGTTDYYTVVASADPGTSQRDLARRLRGNVGSTLRTTTGDSFRFALANSGTQQFKPFLYILMIFAVIACVVAVFVIYNTFTILIAQRMRETALLRCIGADRRQIFGSVLLESAVVGLFGSAVGLALGAGVAYGLGRAAGAIGLGSARHALVVTAAPVLIGTLVGTVSTMASAMVPALRATRVSPLAALGTVATAPATGLRRRFTRFLIAALIAVLGTGLTALGWRPDGASMTPMIMVVAGGTINFLAVLVAAPLFVGPLATALAWLPGRLLGVPVRLASANARRAPGRTAATTAALMIGVGLISAASVSTESVRRTADHQITTNYPVDYMLRPGISQQTAQSVGIAPGIPADLAEQFRADSRFAVVAAVRMDDMTLRAENSFKNGGEFRVAAFEPSGLARLPTIELRAGSLSDLRPGTIVISGDTPMAQGRGIGDRVHVAASTGREGDFTIVGIATGYIAAADALLSWPDLGTMASKNTDDLVMLKAADGISVKSSRAAVTAVTDNYPLVTVSSAAEIRAQITSAVDTAIAVVAALLGFAIVIALIGIMNTLSLSVLERTRESATIRALGLTRGQLRLTLLAESVLMALIGALIGGGLGVLYGWATTRVMFVGMTVLIAIPFGKLLMYIALAATAGVIAALLPARRAARASVVAAMADI